MDLDQELMKGFKSPKTKPITRPKGKGKGLLSPKGLLKNKARTRSSFLPEMFRNKSDPGAIRKNSTGRVKTTSTPKVGKRGTLRNIKMFFTRESFDDFEIIKLPREDENLLLPPKQTRRISEGSLRSTTSPEYDIDSEEVKPNPQNKNIFDSKKHIADSGQSLRFGLNDHLTEQQKKEAEAEKKTFFLGSEVKKGTTVIFPKEKGTSRTVPPNNKCLIDIKSGLKLPEQCEEEEEEEEVASPEPQTPPQPQIRLDLKRLTARPNTDTLGPAALIDTTSIRNRPRRRGDPIQASKFL